MNQHESRIRDYLSENLQIIEEGMLLVKKEFHIQNNLGAGGFIDILAKDSLGHFTIIEIKRSNEAARAALHELTKYSILLTSSLGIKIHNIRAILVSTEWHELSTPFSEYLRTTNISTIGLVISANQDGKINKVSQFIPQEEVEPLKIERAHQVHLFENKEDREKALNPLSIAAQKASILDFAILTTDYSGGNSTVIHPYGAYFVFSSPVNYQNSKRLKEFIKTSKIPWEDLDDPAENFLCRLGDFTKFNYSSFEIGYPEKLSAMAADGWKVNVAVRQGKYSSNTAVISNDALIREAMQIEGGASHYFYGSSSPKHKLNWDEFKKNIKHVSLGCSAWSSTLKKILKRAEKDAQTTISVKLFNPGDIVIAIIKAFGANDFRYFPEFQLIENSKDDSHLYLGMLAWNGKIIERQDISFLKIAGGLEGYFLSRQFGAHYDYYDILCNSLNLESIVIKISNPSSPSEKIEILREGKKSAESESEKSPPRTLNEFVQNHPEFRASLINSVRGIADGLI